MSPIDYYIEDRGAPQYAEPFLTHLMSEGVPIRVRDDGIETIEDNETTLHPWERVEEQSRILMGDTG